MLNVSVPILVRLGGENSFYDTRGQALADIFGGGFVRHTNCLKASFVEVRDNLILTLSKIESEVVGEEVVIHENAWANFSYNKKTKTFIHDDAGIDFSYIPEELFGWQNSWLFLALALKDFNPYLYDAAKNCKGLVYLKDSSREHEFQKWLKAYLLISEHPALLENMMKSSYSLWRKNISVPYKEFIQRFETKIPTQISQWMRDIMGEDSTLYNAMMELLATIVRCGDGNDAVVFWDFFKSWYALDFRRVICESEKFAKDFIYLLECGYNTTKLLKYIQRQNFYYGTSETPIPYNELNLLRDYIEIGKKNDLSTEVYPQWVHKAHNCLVKNVRAQKLSAEEIQKFSDNVAGYKFLEGTIDNFVIKVPTCPKDLVEEGNALSHCVGGYINRIAAGTSKILFLRRKDSPNQPLYTFEINENLDVIHAKGQYNSDLPDEVMEILNKFMNKKRGKVAKDDD